MSIHNNQYIPMKSRININISTHIGITRLQYALDIAYNKLKTCSDKELIKALAICYASIKMQIEPTLWHFIKWNIKHVYGEAGGGIKQDLLDEVQKRNLDNKYFIYINFAKYY